MNLPAQFASDTRLYELFLPDAQDNPGTLLVEAFAAQEAVNGLGHRDLILLSPDADLDLPTLLGQTASLAISLADGSRTTYSGLINQTELLGSEGAYARYRIRLVPWLWQLTQHHTSRVWQELPLTAIIDAVFAGYAQAAWHWGEDASQFMADARPRSYCVQYRETDYA
ncbi:MAG: contractile injection system protein, VgrG/Pvc8 family [Methylococcaceae bacterium]|jgi:uncharacterized protein involved in type VI secretion and phage assembly